MAETQYERPFAPTLGEDGEPCAECGAPLARDQRYCLNCGRRRGDARIPFLDVLRERGGGGPGAVVDPAPAVVEEPPTGVSSLAVAGALGALAILIGIGVLVGVIAAGGSGDKTAAAPPQVINLGGGGGSATPVSASTFASDWPAGKEGWTVQLQQLPKASTQPAQVAQAKQAASSKGAPEVGALDSDEYGSLDPGQYVVYSGVYDSQKQAKAALSKVKKNFPDAQVVQVSGGGGSGVASGGGDPAALSGKKKEATVDKSQLEKLQNLSPQEYQKQSRKLPDTTNLPGKPPPKDSKQPGAGTHSETIQ